MQELQTIFQQRNKDIESLENHLKVIKKIQNASRQAQHFKNLIKQASQMANNKEGEDSEDFFINEKIKTLGEWSEKQDKFREEIESFPKKFQYQEKQRMRVQRQNWILKIIKSAKNINEPNLQFIYQISWRMMDYYHKRHPKLKSSPQDEISKSSNTTEAIINLFMNFYSDYRSDEVPKIKKIIRPNNKFIIFDLLKQLVQTHRHFFKIKLLQSFKQITKNETLSKNPLPQSDSSFQKTEEVEDQESQPQKEHENSPVFDLNRKLDAQMQTFLNQYHQSVIASMGTPANLKDRANSLYNELLELNQNKGVHYSINKYYEKCWNYAFSGEKQQVQKNLKNNGYNYDISKLYTQEEISKIQKKIESRISQNERMVEQFNKKFLLSNQNSISVLQEYFKLSMDTSINRHKLSQIQRSVIKPNSKEEIEQINQWVPLTLRKYIGQFYRLQIYVVYNQQLVPISEFQGKIGVTLKTYLKACRNEYEKKIIAKKRRGLNMKKGQFLNETEVNLKYFRKNRYFSLNMSKVKELLCDQVSSRLFLDASKKKQSIFPILRNNQIKQAQFLDITTNKRSSKSLGNGIKNKSVSEQKLAPLFKNQLLNQKLQAIENESFYKYKSKTQLESRQEEGLKSKGSGSVKIYETNELYAIKTNLAKIDTRKNKKIDSIIDSIINQRNMKIG